MDMQSEVVEMDTWYEWFCNKKTEEFLHEFQKKFKKSACLDYHFNQRIDINYSGFSFELQVPSDEFNNSFLKKLEEVVQKSRLDEGTLKKRVVVHETDSNNTHINELRISVFYKPHVIRSLARNLYMTKNDLSVDVDRVLKMLAED